MKSKASLVLMEQLVMVLVFALAAAMCLRLFAKADGISAEITRRDEAVVLAQSAAEMLKSCGDPVTVHSQLETGAYSLEIREERTDLPNFSQAQIVVIHEGNVLFTLKTGWQEVRG